MSASAAVRSSGAAFGRDWPNTRKTTAEARRQTVKTTATGRSLLAGPPSPAYTTTQTVVTDHFARRTSFLEKPMLRRPLPLQALAPNGPKKPLPPCGCDQDPV